MRSPVNSPLGSRAPAALHVQEPSSRWLVSSISILRDTGGHATASTPAYRTATAHPNHSSTLIQNSICRRTEATEVDSQRRSGRGKPSKDPRSPRDTGPHPQHRRPPARVNAAIQASAVGLRGVDGARVTPLAAAPLDKRRRGPLRPISSQIPAGNEVGMIGQRPSGDGDRHAQRQQHDGRVHRPTRRARYGQRPPALSRTTAPTPPDNSLPPPPKASYRDPGTSNWPRRRRQSGCKPQQ